MYKISVFTRSNVAAEYRKILENKEEPVRDFKCSATAHIENVGRTKADEDGLILLGDVLFGFLVLLLPNPNYGSENADGRNPNRPRRSRLCKIFERAIFDASLVPSLSVPRMISSLVSPSARFRSMGVARNA
jgi:hypothetical protein